MSTTFVFILTGGYGGDVSCSIAKTAAKPRNWATFDTDVSGQKNWVPQFAEPIAVISMGLPEIGLLQTCTRYGFGGTWAAV